MEDFDPLAAATILSRGIPRLLEANCPPNKLRKYLEQLQLLIFGPPSDPFKKLYGSLLTPQDCLSSLLNATNFRSRLQQKPKDALYLSSVLLGMDELTPAACDFLKDILPHLIISLSTEEVQPCLEQLWNRKDKTSLPISLIECMLHRRCHVEELLVSNYKGALEGTLCSWSQEPFCQWALWSSKSPLIFQTVSSIMNQLLISVKNKIIMLALIKSFVNAVKSLISGENKLMYLYPIELQTFVSLLLKEPPEIQSDICCKNFIEYFITQFEGHMENPYVVLMLLSHFPEWLFVLEKTQPLIGPESY